MNKKIMQLHSTLAKLRASAILDYHKDLNILEDLIKDLQDNYVIAPISTLNKLTKHTVTKSSNDRDFPSATHNLQLCLNTQTTLASEVIPDTDIKQMMLYNIKSYLEQEPEDI